MAKKAVRQSHESLQQSTSLMDLRSGEVPYVDMQRYSRIMRVSVSSTSKERNEARDSTLSIVLSS